MSGQVEALLTPAMRKRLQAVSVATITTTLYKRGLRNQLIQGVQPVGGVTGKRRMMGPAYTLRYMPAREDLNQLDVFKDRSHPQRRAIEECPAGHVLVMDSRKDPRAASAGGILTTRLQQRGVEGVVSDGGFRDSTEIARLEMPAYHQQPSPPTNLTLHQAIDLNVPIGCGDAPVFPGDLVFGDDEGVVIIPAHVAKECLEEALEMTAFEDFVMERVQAGQGILGLYPPTDPKSLDDFAAWREQTGR